MTVLKNRFKTEGSLSEKTFSEIYFGLKLKSKADKRKVSLNIKVQINKHKLISKMLVGFIGGETEGI